MRRFLYYFPGVGGMNPRMLSNFGALDRFAASGGKTIAHGCSAINDGPAGPGCVVAAPETAPDLRRAEWIKGDRFWVAVEEPDRHPTPADLERDVGLSGYPMLLGDGNQWRIPLIYRWEGDRQALNVPSSLHMSGGRIERRIRPEYAAVAAIASRSFAGFVSVQTRPLPEAFADAVALLSVNYRIGIEEAGLLGLLSDEAAVATLLGLCIDVPGIQRAAAEAETQGIVFSDNEPALAEGAD